MIDYEQANLVKTAIKTENVHELQSLVDNGLNMRQKFENSDREYLYTTPIEYACHMQCWKSALFFLHGPDFDPPRRAQSPEWLLTFKILPHLKHCDNFSDLVDDLQRIVRTIIGTANRRLLLTCLKPQTLANVELFLNILRQVEVDPADDNAVENYAEILFSVEQLVRDMLVYSAMHANDLEELQRVVDQGVDITRPLNIHAYNFKTPFEIACYYEEWWTVALFFLNRHILLGLDSLNDRPVIIVEHKIIAFAFEKYGSDYHPDTSKLTLIWNLCKIMDQGELNSLLLSDNVKKIKVVLKLVLEAGANVNMLEREYDDSPLLHGPINTQCFWLLIKNGANPLFSCHGNFMTPVRFLYDHGFWKDKEDCIAIILAYYKNLELPRNFFSQQQHYDHFKTLQVKIEDARAQARSRRLTLFMGTHARLGSESHFRDIPPEILHSLFLENDEAFDTLRIVNVF
jgi:hypothetical protein